MDIDGEQKNDLVVDDILGKFNEISFECGILNPWAVNTAPEL